MDTCWLVVVVFVLGLIALIGLSASIVEFIIWVRYTDRRFDDDHSRVRASPAVATVWFLLGMAVLVLLYIVLSGRSQ
jgi:hypothetical protein